MSTAPAISSAFAQCYNSLELGEESEIRDLRWQGVCAAADNADDEQIEALLRLALSGRPARKTEHLSTFRKYFADVDENFLLTGNDRELKVLATASLAKIIDDDDTNAATAALGVTTATMGGTRRVEMPIDLPALSEAALRRIADHARSRPNLGGFTTTEAAKIDIAKALAPFQANNNYDLLVKALNDLGETLRTAIHAGNRRQALSMRALNKYLLVQDEELQMLWWLVGGRSWVRNTEFGSVPNLDRAFAFSLDLARFTQVLPGPISVTALMSRAGVPSDEVATVPDAVNSLEELSISPITDFDAACPVRTPLHFAFQRQRETGPGSAWVANWAAATEQEVDHKHSLLSLATLFYRERLLLDFQDI